MKGSVKGHYLAIKPDEVEEIIKEGALKGFVTEAGVDVNKKKRLEAAAETGVVIAVGPMCWKAYDYDKPGWEPWCEVGDRVWFVRHSAKLIDDKDDLDSSGNPKKIFVIPDENITWNEGKADE